MCDKTDLDLPNNFMQTLPAAEQAFRAISTIWMLLGNRYAYGISEALIYVTVLMFPLYTTGLLSKIRISRSNYKFKSIPWPDDTVVCIFMEVKAYEADCWCNAIMGRRKRQHLDAARIYGRSASSPGDPYHISIYRGRAGTGPACMPVHMKSGERFFCSEDLA